MGPDLEPPTLGTLEATDQAWVQAIYLGATHPLSLHHSPRGVLIKMDISGRCLDLSKLWLELRNQQF